MKEARGVRGLLKVEGRNGYDPFPTDSQSVMLPLHHRPINWRGSGRI